MRAADQPVQRRPSARLLVVGRDGDLVHAWRSDLLSFLRPGDLLIANDAAPLPASLQGIRLPDGAAIEVRLAGRATLGAGDVKRFSAVVFGEGDFHTRTEDRPLPPALAPGDRLALGPLSATIERLLDHPRLVALGFDGSEDEIWSGLARHGRPIQYAHIQSRLDPWDVWAPISGPPVAFEPPSAGFALDWKTVAAMRRRDVDFATLTHAAGISSTGDDALDRRLPFDEPYCIPANTVAAIQRARQRGGRVIAVGTTVVRALEHADDEHGKVIAGPRLATQRIGPETRLRVVNAILSGTHEPGTSHYELLRAFADDLTLLQATREMEARGYLTHEFGDSVLIESAGRSENTAR